MFVVLVVCECWRSRHAVLCLFLPKSELLGLRKRETGDCLLAKGQAGEVLAAVRRVGVEVKYFDVFVDVAGLPVRLESASELTNCFLPYRLNLYVSFDIVIVWRWHRLWKFTHKQRSTNSWSFIFRRGFRFDMECFSFKTAMIIKSIWVMPSSFKWRKPLAFGVKVHSQACWCSKRGYTFDIVDAFNAVVIVHFSEVLDCLFAVSLGLNFTWSFEGCYRFVLCHLFN